MRGEQAEADRALAQGLTAVKVPLNILFNFFSQVDSSTLSHIFPLLLEPTTHGKATVS